jgi:polyhydroxyalkanoate synthesis regulator phasin
VNGKVIAAIEMVEDVTGQNKSEEELQKRLQELEVFYKASIGREERILELKKEVEQLKKELGR